MIRPSIAARFAPSSSWPSVRRLLTLAGVAVLTTVPASGQETDAAASEQASEEAGEQANDEQSDDSAESTDDAANAPKRLAKTGRAIVTAQRAAVQLQDEDPKPVLSGTVVYYSIVNGPWIWSDKHWGWINRGDVVALDEAVSFYTDAIGEAKEEGEDGVPRLRAALHQRGIAKLALGDPDGALKDFTEASERGYESNQVQINIANAHRELGDLDAAIEAANEAIKTSESAEAYRVRSSVLFEQDYFEAALKDADRAVELDPKNAEALNDRGVVKRVMGQWREAAEDYTAALKVSPRHQQALANRGYVLKKLGRFKEAVRDYQRAIRINPTEAVVHNDLAWLLATCPDESIRTPAEAVRHAEKAVELTDRKDGRFLDTLAAAYAAMGDYGRATETGLEAVKLLSDAEQYEADQRVDLYADGQPYVEE